MGWSDVSVRSPFRLELGWKTALLIIAATPAAPLFSQTGDSRVSSGKELPAPIEIRAPLDNPLDIHGPGVLATDAFGNVYVSVRDGIFKVDPSGLVSRVAGIGRDWRYSGDGGPAIRAGMNPGGLAVDPAGNLYLADTGNHRVRRLDAATGVVTTVAGTGDAGFSGDGSPATLAQLDGPTGVAIDKDGNLYIADGTRDGKNRIRRIDGLTGFIETVAGNGSQGFSGDGGPAALAQFSSLGGLATDASGNLYIADNFNNRVRMVSAATGIITTVAGNGVAGFLGDGGPAIDARLNNPLSVALDSAGNLYIADSGNYRIRKVTLASRTIATVGAGDVVYRDPWHGFPCAVAADSTGSLYVADSGTSRIRSLPPGGLIGVAGAPTPISFASSSSSGFKINVTYDSSVPAAAQTAFNNLISTYESVFTTNITVNIDVNFGNTGLGSSSTQLFGVSYSAWREAVTANATANPGNTYLAAAAASLPVNDPIGQGDLYLTTANARALGFTANAAVDSTLTFSNAVIFEYTGIATSGASDFLDVAAHELDEGLGIGSALTGLQNNAPIPSDDYANEDYFRYSAASTRDITTNPNAVVYFSYDGGNTNVAQFNQAYSALGDSDLDRNDWIYGNSGCPSATVHVQDAILCTGQAVAIGSGPEITVLDTLGYESVASSCTVGLAPQNRSFSSSGGSSSVIVADGSGCGWTATTDSSSWITLNGSSGSGDGSFSFTIASNSTGQARLGTVTVGTQSFKVMEGGTTALFTDVPVGSQFFDYISLMYSSGITAGCSTSPMMYCPANDVTREQMAVFMVVSLDLALGTPLSYPPTAYFQDVASTSSYFPFVQKLAELGISGGCSSSPPLFCPTNTITQEQMAVFTIVAWMLANDLSTFTYTETPYFTDVPSTSIYFKFIQKMMDMGFWTGCGNNQYCPTDAVTRGDMAPMIMRAVMGAP